MEGMNKGGRKREWVRVKREKAYVGEGSWEMRGGKRDGKERSVVFEYRCARTYIA